MKEENRVAAREQIEKINGHLEHQVDAKMDDFGKKSTSPAATAHLLQALLDKYTIPTDPDGIKYLGFTLKWDYVLKKV